MKLDAPFYRLPLRFDADRLAAECLQFSEEEWRAHPQAHAGNSAIPLVAAGGNPADDGVKGAMRPTPFLDRCPYIRQVLASLRTVLGRTRLMRIAGGGEATPHVDSNYYCLHHLRVHVPAVTFPEVQFVCDDQIVHMPPGGAWVFDTWRTHNVLNPADRARIHLVADTVGGAHFWELVEGSEYDPSAGRLGAPEPVHVMFRPEAVTELDFEAFNFPIVMSPWEQECLIADAIEPLGAMPDGPDAAVGELQAMLVLFNRHWPGLWAKFGDRPPGWPIFAQMLQRLDAALDPWCGKLILPNQLDVIEALRQAIIRPALNPELANRRDNTGPPGSASAVTGPAPSVTSLERPIFIVAAPRSGSSLLFETLARSPDAWTLGAESHEVFEGITQLQPAQRGYTSNRLTAEDATPEVAAAIRSQFLSRVHDRTGRPVSTGLASIRLLEKTPKNTLRIPFLRAVFPDAIFIYLYREPRGNLSSIIEAWESGRFVTYPDLPDWDGLPWSLVLTPGWARLRGRPLAEIALHQWRSVHEQVLADLADLPAGAWTGVSYDEFLSNPRATVERLTKFSGIAWDDPLDQPLPNARHTLSPPAPEKWRRHAAEIEPLLPGIASLIERVETVLASANGSSISSAACAAPTTPAPRPAARDEPLASSFTSGLAELLRARGLSLLVSTYQAGKLVLVRGDGGKVNTHFRSFASPMGLAVRGQRLAIGDKVQVWEFHNQAEVAQHLKPAGKHDAVYLPRSSHFTGDVRIHDVAFAGDELWLANTRFSCLCTLEPGCSFVPRWRPPFVSDLAPEDRCHLNGLAVVDNVPRFVTCLGVSDLPGGWRETKRSGGVVVDVPSNAIVLRGLSMPHSPRWHDGRLWLLESGDGSIGYVDPKAGKYCAVARLPGFTRGLDFDANLAFVGLSQVRESAIFGGLPLTERPEPLVCGIWVVDLSTGRTVGFVRFATGVQEIFAVQVLRGQTFPELLNENEDVIASSYILP